MKKLAALAIIIPLAVSAHAQSFTLVDTWTTAPNSTNGNLDAIHNAMIHPNGYVYLADHYNHNVQRWTKNGQYVDSFGSLGSANGQFNRPLGMGYDNSGNIFIADQENFRIQKFSAAGQYLSSWGSFGSGPGQFNTVEAGLMMTVSKSGFVYVGDGRNQRVQKFDLNGNYISEWGTGGSSIGQFNFIGGMTTDSAGNVYVSDYYNNRVQVFDGNGTFLRSWGTGTFNGPTGITVAPDGNVIVGDRFNNRILAFSNTGTLLSSYGSPGSGDLYHPFGMDIDSTGMLVVTDLYPTDGKQIKVFQYGNPSNPGVVPEPSEWAAMGLLGAGLLGLVVKNRKKNLEAAK
jgi:DNA-binding beta-propeller fold protein YncE